MGASDVAVTVLVGTKRGLFLLRSDPERRDWRLDGPTLEGREVFHAVIDPRDRRTAWAATSHAVWGSHVHRSDDGGTTWDVMPTSPSHVDERGLKAIWALAPGSALSADTLFAGIEPAGLFRSDDRGETWSPVAALNEHPTRSAWQPAGGSLALHSIVVDPRDPSRLFCAISAGGVYRSDDDGTSWTALNAGVRAEFLPDPRAPVGQCVHKLLLHPAQPDRLYQQNHCGTYRSDDGGETWVEITEGLPSDFGYALALDAGDPDVAYVIPEESSHMRTVAEGRLRVYRTGDAGASWAPQTQGLPQAHAYVSVLREAMDADGLSPLGLYFGTSGGHLFASRDAGRSWRALAEFLPRILSVTTSPA